MYDIFNALHYTAYKDVKVVILGQDPYHGPNQAHGLSFSVKPGVPAPPSLINIFKELNSDLGCYIPNNGYLKNGQIRMYCCSILFSQSGQDKPTPIKKGDGNILLIG